MSIQLFVALAALVAGLFCFVSPPEKVRFAVGGWHSLDCRWFCKIAWTVFGYP